MGVIDNRIDSGNFGRPMQPSGGQPPMNLETRQKGPYSPAMQEYFRQDAINQARRGMTPAQRQLDSQGMQIPNWMKGKADTLPASGPLGRLTPPKQQQLPTPVMPLMPPKKQVMPTPVMPPNIGARDPRFKTGGLATMPKKGKC
jgi:hypothetical protein